MQDLNDKVTGNSLTATEWDQVPSEIQAVIEGVGQTLSGADLNQLGKAVAGYVANGTFYTDSGAANAYVLTQIGTKQAPHAYANGMEIVFLPGNASTGASTVNVASLGVKDLRDPFGTALTDSTLSTAAPAAFRYDSTAGHFRMRGAELITRTAPWSVTHNMASDADYTLTATQEQYGRVVITDTSVLLTVPRNIIVSKARRKYNVLNSTAQSLTFKTAAGSGIAVPVNNITTILSDGTNVVSVVQPPQALALYTQEITSTGTFTMPNAQVFAALVGGGGGASIVVVGGAEGGGGASGDLALLEVPPYVSGTVLTVNIGAAGAGRTGSTGNGTAGGTTSIVTADGVTIASAPGGAGATQDGVTGQGGVAGTLGAQIPTGYPGLAGEDGATDGNDFGGDGANSIYRIIKIGGTYLGGLGSTVNNGAGASPAAGVYGAGGGAGTGAGSGANGSVGVAYFWWYA